MTDQPRMLRVYLGDGLYGEFDGHMVTLRTEREDRPHWVYLEPEVMQSFLVWIKTLMLIFPDRADGWEP